MFGCQFGRPALGPAIDIGDIPGLGPGPPGPGPKLLFGGGPRIPPGPYEPGPIGIPGPRGGFIRGAIGFIVGGPATLVLHYHHLYEICLHRLNIDQKKKKHVSVNNNKWRRTKAKRII